MAKVIANEKLIDELLERGADEVVVKDHLRKRLLSGEKLRIKFGIDPTGSVLHLGHAVALKKLREFQNLGHQVILLIGDFTAQIGDPTGRSETRKPMTREEIVKNMESYQEQAGLILDLKQVEVRYNSEWLANMDLKEIIMLTSKITYAQMAQRADFKDRIKKEQDLSIQEFLYPAMQGYDSVELKADVEIGGTDQKFNLLMGRQLQKRYGQEPQDILTCPLLEGLDGEAKMSKSYGNYISLTEEPNSMFGKIMSLPDKMIIRYFNLCTELTSVKIKEIENKLNANTVNPRDIKMQLAREIVREYHGEELANAAQEYFEKVFSKREAPEEMEEIGAKKEETLADIVLRAGFAKSKADARRKIEQGGVSIDGHVIKEYTSKLTEKDDGKVMKVGKRHFGRIKIS